MDTSQARNLGDIVNNLVQINKFLTSHVKDHPIFIEMNSLMKLINSTLINIYKGEPTKDLRTVYLLYGAVTAGYVKLRTEVLKKECKRLLPLLDSPNTIKQAYLVAKEFGFTNEFVEVNIDSVKESFFIYTKVSEHIAKFLNRYV